MESSRKCWLGRVLLVLKVNPRADLSASRSPCRAHPALSEMPSKQTNFCFLLPLSHVSGASYGILGMFY